MKGAPMVLLLDGFSYAAAMAALDLALPYASPEIKPHFETAIEELRAARDRWINTDASTVPALLRRQAE